MSAAGKDTRSSIHDHVSRDNSAAESLVTHRPSAESHLRQINLDHGAHFRSLDLIGQLPRSIKICASQNRQRLIQYVDDYAEIVRARHFPFAIFQIPETDSVPH